MARNSLIGIVMLFAVLACLADDGLSLESRIDPPALSQMEYRDGRLSLSATNSSIVELLRLIGKSADFEIVVYGGYRNQRGSWSFLNLPLTEAVKKLLSATNAVIVFDRVKANGNDIRISKIYLLGEGGSEEELVRINTVVPDLENRLLVSQMRQNASQDRVAAIDRLQGLTDELTVNGLAFSLRHDPDPLIRGRAAAALGDIGGEAATTALETGLGDEDSSVRIKVVQALGKLQDERIALWLGQVIMGDSSAGVRQEALKATTLHGHKYSRLFLAAAMGDKSVSVRETATRLME